MLATKETHPHYSSQHILMEKNVADMYFLGLVLSSYTRESTGWNTQKVFPGHNYVYDKLNTQKAPHKSYVVPAACPFLIETMAADFKQHESSIPSDLNNEVHGEQFQQASSLAIS